MKNKDDGLWVKNKDEYKKLVQLSLNRFFKYSRVDKKRNKGNKRKRAFYEQLYYFLTELFIREQQNEDLRREIAKLKFEKQQLEKIILDEQADEAQAVWNETFK